MSAGSRLTREQLAAFQSIPDEQTEGLAPALEKISTNRYIDPEFFAREKQKIFRRVPLPITVSAELPGRGTFLRQDILGIPLLLARAQNGTVHAFINVCRHRGVVLCPSQEPQAGNRIICPYHAWTYSLEGQLISVPRAEIFQDLDKKDYGLTALPCVEAGGLIWIGLTPGGDYDFGAETGPLARELQGMRLDETRLVQKRSYDVRANWKLIMDTTLDSYHVTRLHRTTVAPYFSDSPVRVARVGLHLRNASARGNFNTAALSDDISDVRQVAVLTYQLFPGGVIILSPDYISVELFRPIAHDRTRVDFLMLTHHPASDEKMNGKLSRSFEFMDKVFGQEDFWAAALAQEGLSTGDLADVTAGGMEDQMRVFHDIVDDFVNR